MNRLTACRVQINNNNSNNHTVLTAKAFAGLDWNMAETDKDCSGNKQK